jgi:Kef-type K+ transport system membrane component KefB
VSVLTELLLLIVVARSLGKLFSTFGQPSLIGEIIAGILLGPTLLNLIHPSPSLHAISELAIFFIIFTAGQEMELKDVTDSLKGKGLLIALLGFFIPFLCGWFLGNVYYLDKMRTVFLALCISITALPVAVRILENFKMLDTEIAKRAISTAVVNDLVALMILGALLNLPNQRDYLSLVKGSGLIIFKLFVLLGTIWAVDQLIRRFDREGTRVQKFLEKIVRLFGEEALFGIVAIFVLVFGSLSDLLGFHFIIGSFFGALIISKEYFLKKRRHELERTISSISNGFLSPVFFAFIGLEFNVSKMNSVSFVLSVLVISIGSKIISGYLGGKFLKMSNKDALGLGIILNGRGVMEIVVASIALQKGFIGQSLFSTLILMGLVTTMITPTLFSKLFSRKETP